MSTWIYLECLDHDPALRAEDESGQHLYDLPRIREEIARRDELAVAHEAETLPAYDWKYPNIDHYFQAHSARFLAAHPKCRIGIRDEYGDVHPVSGDTEKTEGQ